MSESVEAGISRADANAASRSGGTAAARSCSASGLRHYDATNEKRQEPWKPNSSGGVGVGVVGGVRPHYKQTGALLKYDM